LGFDILQDLKRGHARIGREKNEERLGGEVIFAASPYPGLGYEV